MSDCVFCKIAAGDIPATVVHDDDDVVAFRNQMEAVRAHMAALIRGGLRREQAAERIVTTDLSWTMAESGLFMTRSIPGFYDEIAAEVR